MEETTLTWKRRVGNMKHLTIPTARLMIGEEKFQQFQRLIKDRRCDINYIFASMRFLIFYKESEKKIEKHDICGLCGNKIWKSTSHFFTRNENKKLRLFCPKFSRKTFVIKFPRKTEYVQSQIIFFGFLQNHLQNQKIGILEFLEKIKKEVKI